MTKEDLKRLGIISNASTLYPNSFFVPCLGQVDLLEPYKIETIFEMLYRSGERAGIERGKKIKISEFKKALDIDEE